MKLTDISHGPYWVQWLMFAVFAVLSVILISGHGSWLVAGYNTADDEQKQKYNAKRLCRTVGIGVSVIAVLILVMALFENELPAEFAYFAIAVVVIDCLLIIIFANTVCRK